MPKVNTFIIILVYLLILTLWQLLSPLAPTLSLIFPPPLAILNSLISNIPLFLNSLLITARETLLGLTLSVIIALPLAFLFERFKPLTKLSTPALVAWQATPSIVIAPLMILWFGLGRTSTLMVVASICSYPMLINALNGIKNTSADHLNLLKSYGASPFQLFYLVKWPQAVLGFFSGLKIAASYAVGACITGEWLGGSRGLGVLLLQSRRSFNYPAMYAAVFLIIALSLLFFRLAGSLESLVTKKLHYRNN